MKSPFFSNYYRTPHYRTTAPSSQLRTKTFCFKISQLLFLPPKKSQRMMQSAGEGHKSKKKKKKLFRKQLKPPFGIIQHLFKPAKNNNKKLPRKKKFLYCSKCMAFSHQASSKGRRQASQFSNLQLCVLYIGGSYIPLVLN